MSFDIDPAMIAAGIAAATAAADEIQKLVASLEDKSTANHAAVVAAVGVKTGELNAALAALNAQDDTLDAAAEAEKKATRARLDAAKLAAQPVVAPPAQEDDKRRLHIKIPGPDVIVPAPADMLKVPAWTDLPPAVKKTAEADAPKAPVEPPPVVEPIATPDPVTPPAEPTRSKVPESTPPIIAPVEEMRIVPPHSMDPQPMGMQAMAPPQTTAPTSDPSPAPSSPTPDAPAPTSPVTSNSPPMTPAPAPEHPPAPSTPDPVMPEGQPTGPAPHGLPDVDPPAPEGEAVSHDILTRSLADAGAALDTATKARDELALSREIVGSAQATLGYALAHFDGELTREELIAAFTAESLAVLDRLGVSVATRAARDAHARDLAEAKDADAAPEIVAEEAPPTAALAPAPRRPPPTPAEEAQAKLDAAALEEWPTGSGGAAVPAHPPADAVLTPAFAAPLPEQEQVAAVVADEQARHAAAAGTSS